MCYNLKDIKNVKNRAQNSENNQKKSYRWHIVKDGSLDQYL